MTALEVPAASSIATVLGQVPAVANRLSLLLAQLSLRAQFTGDDGGPPYVNEEGRKSLDAACLSCVQAIRRAYPAVEGYVVCAGPRFFVAGSSTSSSHRQSRLEGCLSGKAHTTGTSSRRTVETSAADGRL